MNRLRRTGKHNEQVKEQAARSAQEIQPDQVEAPNSALSGANGETPHDNGSLGAGSSASGLPGDTVGEEVGAPARDAGIEMPMLEQVTGGEAGVEDNTPTSGFLVEQQIPDEVEAAAQGPQEASQGEAETAPLPQVAEHEELVPLPVNAVVDGRYVVQTQLHHSQDRNLYRVVARHQQRCAVCGYLSPVDAENCPRCDAPLAGQAPAEFYLMAESYRPEALMQDTGLMDLHLYHPNLVPVVDFFEYKPFGHARHYAIAEPRQGVRLSQLSLPRPGAQVLNWAMQLADALDYLHSRNVVGAGAESDDILVQGDRASLASLQNARGNVPTEEERIQHQVLDLARLAGTMYEAYTGHAPTMTPEGILPMPPAAPEQIGLAFRAAIEPAQGIAPAIGAAQWRDQLAKAMEAIVELERPGRPVTFVSAGLTDVGQLRELNEDSYGMAEFVQTSVERPMRLGLYVVADGMGGHKGGEVASALAVQTFMGEVAGRLIAPVVSAPGERASHTNETILQGMIRATQSANERIYKARDNRQTDMGTTLVAALISGGKAYIINIGDSRSYLYSAPRNPSEAESQDTTAPLSKGSTSPLEAAPKQTNVLVEEPAIQIETEAGAELDRSDYVLSQVSVDHSLVHRLVELGQLDPEEAKVHPHRNFIYRSIGGPPPVEVDTFVRTLRPGDRLLLCSDGLNSMVEDQDIEAVLASEPDPQAACRKLIDLANEMGGHDNITAILVDIGGYLPSPEHPFAMNNT